MPMKATAVLATIGTILFACLNWIALTEGLAAQEFEIGKQVLLNRSILSSIDGSTALSEITELVKWHKLLNLDSGVLEELRSLKSGKEIDEIIKKRGKPENRIALRIMRDKLIKERLEEILDPHQRSLIRIHVLKDHYFSPANIMRRDASLLIELGMSEEEFATIVENTSPKIKGVLDEVKHLVKDSLDSITSTLSEDKANKIWDLFGRDFMSLPRSGLSWDQIQVLPQTGPKNQLMFASTLVLDDDLKLSQSQTIDIVRIQNREIVNFVGDRSAEISNDLERILSKSQRSAIVLGLQRNMLVSDMRVLSSREVIKFVGLEKEEVVVVREMANDAARRVQDFRFEKEMELLKRETRHMPNDFQKKLAELVEGVWK